MQPDGPSVPASGRPIRWRMLSFALAGVAVVVVGGWVLFGSRLLVVRVIAVTGVHRVSGAQVLAAANVPAGTPLVRVDPAQVAQRVEAIRQVASVQVSQDWPDGLSITVQERQPAMAVKMADGGYDLVDHDGVIVTWAQAKPAGLPLLATSTAGSQLRGDASVALASQVLAGLPPWLSRQVTEVEVSDSASVTLTLSHGRTVVWGGADRAGFKDRELAILMRDGARYFDVSDPGTAVTR